ncbi:hypothetical protein IJ21_30740 [Paenibacillus sp. 32O-W]|uniref:hypothetical protein n=1 Tax=Paenibacillus sp. 32O-W TaxID=1695218 RepID=UPI0007205ECE|nr:hypothetical protein [Paenibacillus sp. 32O-W]ALS28470.1 hypothetical protein IJ21_30740 [Paenibacillus sp. 32O-W]
MLQRRRKTRNPDQAPDVPLGSMSGSFGPYAGGSASAGFPPAGKKRRIVVPSPGAVATSMAPPIASTSAFVTAKSLNVKWDGGLNIVQGETVEGAQD